MDWGWRILVGRMGRNKQIYVKKVKLKIWIHKHSYITENTFTIIEGLKWKNNKRL